MSKKSIEEALKGIQNQYIQNNKNHSIDWVALDTKILSPSDIAEKDKECDAELLEDIEKTKKIITGKGKSK